MKIIKSFEDSAFFAKHFPSKNGTWLWGLGEDGELYFKCSQLEYADSWCIITCSLGDGFHPKIRDMKLIVKEFGHLLVWL